MQKLIFKKLPIGMLKVEVNKNKNNKLKIGLNEILQSIIVMDLRNSIGNPKNFLVSMVNSLNNFKKNINTNKYLKK
jgi:hypothetical protein